MDSREQFEAWTKCPQPEGTYDLTRIPSGAYKNAETRVAFQAWQASREALVVELPKKYVIDGVPVVTVAELKIRLDKAGIKWK